MELNETQFGDGIHLLGYGNGGFRLSGDQVHEGSLLLLPDGPLAIKLSSVAEMDLELAEFIKQAAPQFDVLLVGCGDRIAPMPPKVRQILDAADIPFDLMDTGAACRTFNVLLAEERRVAALLIAMA
ncbi:MAG: Mth938-like domain-containing protein [Alphaproteobacteria bacterium]